MLYRPAISCQSPRTQCWWLVMRLAECFDVIVSALESRAGGQYDMVMLHAICSLQVAQILMRLSNPQPLALSEASLSPRLGQNHNHNFDRRLSAKASFYLGRSGHRSLRVSVHSVSVSHVTTSPRGFAGLRLKGFSMWQSFTGHCGLHSHSKCPVPILFQHCPAVHSRAALRILTRRLLLAQPYIIDYTP